MNFLTFFSFGLFHKYQYRGSWSICFLNIYSTNDLGTCLSILKHILSCFDGIGYNIPVCSKSIQVLKCFAEWGGRSRKHRPEMCVCYLHSRNTKQELPILLIIDIAVLGVQNLTLWDLLQPEASAECCKRTWDFFSNNTQMILFASPIDQQQTYFKPGSCPGFFLHALGHRIIESISVFFLY